jgi:hypothetical protein
MHAAKGAITIKDNRIPCQPERRLYTPINSQAPGK